MKACWKKDPQAVASEPQNETVIETVHNFCDPYKALMLQGLWNGNFAEFGNNGLLSCITVVHFN